MSISAGHSWPKGYTILTFEWERVQLDVSCDSLGVMEEYRRKACIV